MFYLYCNNRLCILTYEFILEHVINVLEKKNNYLFNISKDLININNIFF